MKTTLQDKIVSTDPKAQALLRHIYETINNSESFEEIGNDLCKEIEAAYSKEDNNDTYFLEGIIQQAQEALQEEVFTEDHAKLHQVLIDMVYDKGVNQKLYKSFFDDLEETVQNITQLNFSKKVDLTEVNGSKKNVLSYFAMNINTIVDQLKYGVVSMQIADHLNLSCSPKSVYVVDENGIIKYCNHSTLQIFRLDSEDVIDLPIDNFIPYGQQFLTQAAHQENICNAIVPNGSHPFFEGKYMNVSLLDNNEGLLEYVISITDKKSREIDKKSLPINFPELWTTCLEKEGLTVSQENMLISYDEFYGVKKDWRELFDLLLEAFTKRKKKNIDQHNIHFKVVENKNTNEIYIQVEENGVILRQSEINQIVTSSKTPSITIYNLITKAKELGVTFEAYPHAPYGNVWRFIVNR